MEGSAWLSNQVATFLAAGYDVREAALIVRGVLPRAARRDLIGQPLVALVPHADHPRLHEHLLRQLRTEPDGSQVPLTVAADEPFTLEHMLPLVVAGTGIGLLPLTLAAEVPNQEVVLCPFMDQPPSASVTLLWRRDDTRRA